MNTQARRTQMLVVALLLFIPVALLQRGIDPIYHKNYAPSQSFKQGAKNLPVEMALGAFTGFREAVAGMLWVRCDEFFHNGDYEAIMPLIRVITWLDPHQIDVYETGAWHMDYNFTDSSERSDRRYIPFSLSLLGEGIANNPDEPDLYSDMGFVHYFRKIEDFPKAAQWFEKGWAVVRAKNLSDANDPTQFDEADKGVMTVGHGLAHAYEFSGNIPAALDQWNKCLALHDDLIKQKSGDASERMDKTIAEKQIYELQGRLKYRPIDTAKPLDMHFAPQLVRVAPKVFVLKGTLEAIGATKFNLETGERTFGPFDGCRVEIRLQDEGYKLPVLGAYTLSSSVNPTVTIMQDAISVRGGKIGGDQGHKIDMSKDLEMYRFQAPRYTVTAYFMPNNPNDAPIQVQDRIGWKGEGLGPQANLVVSDGKTPLPGDASPVPGLRYLVKTFTLTRDDILGREEKVFK